METQSEYICPGLETPDYIRVDPGEAAKIYEAGDFIAKYAMEVCMASGSRFIKLPLDYNYEAYVFGSRIKHRSDGMVITQYRYENIDELSWLLTKTYEPKQFGAIFDAIKIASKNGTVMLRVEGVFSILSALINPMKILRALKKKRALITRLMEHMTEILYQYMHQALQNGVSIISYADPVGTIELVGRNEYKKVIGKYTFILMKQLEPDLRQGLMHLCGKCSFALEKCGYLKMIPVPVKEMFYADAVEQSIQTESVRLIGHGCINCEELMISRLWTLKLSEIEGYVGEMTAEDAKAVLSIYGSAIEDGKSTVVTTLPDWSEWDEIYYPDGRFVYCLDQRTVGFAALKYTGIESKDTEKSFEVSIYVHKAYRNMGIGTALLQQVIGYCSDVYGCNIYSHIFADNIASIRLHKKMGFVRIKNQTKTVNHRHVMKEIYTYERKYNGCEMLHVQTKQVI